MMRLEKSLSTQTISLLSIASPSMEPVLQMRKDIRDLNKRMKDMLETIKKSYHQPINYNNGLKLLRKPLNSQEKMLYSWDWNWKIPSWHAHRWSNWTSKNTAGYKVTTTSTKTTPKQCQILKNWLKPPIFKHEFLSFSHLKKKNHYLSSG